MTNPEQIGFAPALVPLVKSGQKTKTYRLGDKYDFLTVGDVIQTNDSGTGQVFANLKITDKSYTTFRDLPITEDGHEIYKSKEDQRKLFEKYYGREVKEDER